MSYTKAPAAYSGHINVASVTDEVQIYGSNAEGSLSSLLWSEMPGNLEVSGYTNYVISVLGSLSAWNLSNMVYCTYSTRSNDSVLVTPSANNFSITISLK